MDVYALLNWSQILLYPGFHYLQMTGYLKYIQFKDGKTFCFLPSLVQVSPYCFVELVESDWQKGVGKKYRN